MAPASERVRVAIALGTLYLIWGSTYLGIRIAIESFPPFLMGALRFLVAGVALYLFLRLRGVPPPTKAQWKGAAILGAFMLVGGFGGVSFAEQWVSSGLAALAVGATPLWAALFAGFWGRWPSRLEWGGLALGFSGLVLLNLDNHVRASSWGAIALLVGPACWGFAAATSRRLTLPPGLMGSAAEMLTGASMLLCISLARGERLHTAPTWHSVLALGYLSLIGSLIGFSCFLYLLSHVRPALATSYAYVNPVVAMGLGVWLAGEHVSSLALIALPTILTGVVLVLAGRERS